MKGNQLEFHCFGEAIDVIMMLDYFENNKNDHQLFSEILSMMLDYYKNNENHHLLHLS